MKTFNENYDRLNEIVEILNGQNFELEEMLKLYEEAMVLSNKLSKQLQDAKDKIKSLTKENNE